MTLRALVQTSAEGKEEAAERSAEALRLAISTSMASTALPSTSISWLESYHLARSSLKDQV
jgi:hypothetical protein